MVDNMHDKDDHFGRMELFMSLLEMNGICKSFNGIQVLKEVSLAGGSGERFMHFWREWSWKIYAYEYSSQVYMTKRRRNSCV